MKKIINYFRELFTWKRYHSNKDRTIYTLSTLLHLTSYDLRKAEQLLYEYLSYNNYSEIGKIVKYKIEVKKFLDRRQGLKEEIKK